MKRKLAITDVVKLFTNVPAKFVDDFFSLYDRDTGQGEFVIDLSRLAKWLKVEKNVLRKTLVHSYKTGVDYIESKVPQENVPHRSIVMITPDCMKRVCMRSRSLKAESVRTYFIEIEEFIVTYNDQIVDGIMRDVEKVALYNMKHPSKDGPGYMYIFQAAKNLIKLGYTEDLKRRIIAYNTGRAKDIEMLYVYRVERRKEVERCVKGFLEGKRFKKRREIYHIDWQVVQKLIQGCAAMSMKLHHKGKGASSPKETDAYYMVIAADE